MKHYTPAALDLLVDACDRADQRKRLAALNDARAAGITDPKAFAKYYDTLDRD